MFLRTVLSSLALYFSTLTLAAAQSEVPERIDAHDWASIREAYDAERHATRASEEGFEARNPRQGWQLKFDRRGFLATPDTCDWTWGLELVSYGFKGAQQFVGQSACAKAEGGRVAYSWDNLVEEWYVNDARGFEHGFTIHERPLHEDPGSTSPLTFRLNVRGELAPTVQPNRRGIRFTDVRGATAVTYSGLLVLDADGQEIPAWFELSRQTIELAVDDQGARYPLTIDPIAQQAYLKASNTGFDDNFGRSLAISNDTIVVGAPREDSIAVGIDGNQADNSAPNSGAAYVFVRNGLAWSQQAYLKASNSGSSDSFGMSVDIESDTIVIGAHGESSGTTVINGNETDNSAPSAGAAYVFVRTGTTWSQQAYFKASNAEENDQFGRSVSLSGDTVLVGAWQEDSNATGVNGNQNSNSAATSGAAYVFVRNGTSWTQQAYLKSSNAETADFLGFATSISGDTLVVGAFLEDSNAAGVNGNQASNTFSNSGAAYTFVRTGTIWTQQAYLKASNPIPDVKFGSAVAVSGDTIVIGAPSEHGSSTGINGLQPGPTTTGLDRSGAAYVFVRTGSTWSQEAYVKASNTGRNDLFGIALDIEDDRLIVGARAEQSFSAGVNGNQTNDFFGEIGAAYLFNRAGTDWTQEAYIKASNPSTNNSFGSSLSISQDTLVVGAPHQSGSSTGVNGTQERSGANSSGAAYVFDLDFDFRFPPQGIDHCSGDGGDQMGCTNCPCSNNATTGVVGGCLNSAATSARLIGEGDPSVSLNPGSFSDLRFSIEGAPPLSFCILNSGDNVGPTNPVNTCFGLASGTQAIQFDGLRCAVTNTRRHGGRSADSNGEVGMPANSWGGEGLPSIGLAQAGGAFTTGQTRHFQVIYRDDLLLSCMRGLNTSQAVEITFTP